MMRRVGLAIAILALLGGGCVLEKRAVLRLAKKLEGPGTRLVWDTTVIGGKVKELYALGDVVCVHTANETLIVFDAEGGAELWRAELPGALQFGPDRHREVFYFTVNDVVYAVEARSGLELWWRAVETPLGSPPALVADRVLAGNRIGSFTAWHARGKKPAWSEPHWEVSEKPAVRGAMVYVAGRDGVVRAVDLESGEVAWEFDTGAKDATTPALRTGGLVFGTGEGGVYSTGEDGKQVWLTVVEHPVKRVRVLGEVAAAMLEPEGVVLLRAETGEEFLVATEARKVAGVSRDIICLLSERELVGISAANGEQVWRLRLGKFRVVAENGRSDVVYAATRNGALAALKLK